MMTQEEDKKLKKLDVEAKLEPDHIFNTHSLSSLRQRSMFKNPRIVRVSRAFGGKDRHSKVTTVKGLRDRRIRLSVPTAIQLYDLQDRLGLSQPSKVVDWLLAHSIDEIDKLPPLQMPHGNFNQFHNPTPNHDSDSFKTTFYPYFNSDLSFFKDGDHQSSEASKDGIRENSSLMDEDIMGKSKVWDVDSSEQNQEETSYNPQISAQNFFPVSSHSSFPIFLHNSNPNNSFYPLEPNSDLSLTQFRSHGFHNQVHERHSSLSQPQQPSGSQLYLYPPYQIPSIIYPNPQFIASSTENDARHSNMYLPNPFMSPLNRHPQSDEKELDKNHTGV